MEVLVVGGGVSGLTTALCLLQAGHRVVICTQERAAETTSSVAAATWYPYAVGGAHADEWALTSLAIFRDDLARRSSETGVLMRPLLYLAKHAEPGPGWLRQVGAHDLAPTELPVGYASGFEFDSPVIDMSIYLGYLESAVLTQGGRIERRSVANWGEMFAQWASAFPPDASEAEAGEQDSAPQMIVNCAGLSARMLAPHDANDSSDGLGVRPARGQVVRIEATGFDRVLLEESGVHPTYIVPRMRDITLGGTSEEGKELRAIDLAVREDILTRCAALALPFDPKLAMSLAALVGGALAATYRARVGDADGATPAARLLPSGQGDAVGLRPLRAEVALKRERLDAGHYVIHNYGHGGGGVTLSWGCAQEVVSLVAAL